MPETVSKKLGHDDESGFYFSQELLGENVTAAVNFDRLQKHPLYGYITFEYLLYCTFLKIQRKKRKRS